MNTRKTKHTSFRSLIGLAFFFMSICGAFAQDAGMKEEFAKLQEQREQRTSLIDYLKSTKQVSETAAGTLSLADNAPAAAKQAVESENKDRQRMFVIIASIQGSTVAKVAKEFAQRMGVDVNAKKMVTTLRVHGSNTVGASLAPALVRAFLKDKGFTGITTDRDGVEAMISYSKPGDNTIYQVEIKAHGSSTAFGETDSNKGVGLLGKFCDIGMASRPMKDKEQEALMDAGMGDMRTAASEFPIALDGVAVVLNRSNPIQALTVEQIAEIFSGKVSNWKQLGGEDLPIQIFARDEQSGTWDTFKSRVLKPFKFKLSENNVKRFEDSALLVRNVAATKGGIGFTGLAYVDSTVKGLAVQAGKEARPFQPTRLTVKTQDYPLARLLYFYLPVNASSLSRDFVKFTMSNDGQEVVDKSGLVGQGLSSQVDRNNADQLKKQLLSDASVPQAYKMLIANSDRSDTQANIRFVQGSNEPDINSLNNLDRLASYLANPGHEKFGVVLVGFADSVGNQSSNLRLSRKRAEEVKALLEAKGVRNITAEGFGEAMPVADNGSESGRAQNRRVEIWLTRK
ncbi:outer membrane protein A [Rubritalea halochordaticola]|uniref:Outer membrane protein A n=1 Tax=Rubritalea halochordaticola TaxID=714537 RepID=A0ABP9V9M8_9BACT